MTEEPKFNLDTVAEENAGSAPESTNEAVVENTAEAPTEKEHTEIMFEKMMKMFDAKIESKAIEESERAKENERVANQHRLLDKAEEIGLSRDELDSRQNVLSSILKKDKLDIFDETTALLDLEHKERASKLEREAQKAKTIEDDIIKKYGEHGKTYLMPKIVEKLDKAANFPLMKTLEGIMSTSKINELRTKLVQHYIVENQINEDRPPARKKTLDELWNDIDKNNQ